MAKFRKGQSGNPSGRPRGSRNKSSLIKAQLTMDDALPAVTAMYVAIANRDEAALLKFGLTQKDITPKLMLEAGKMLIMQSAGEMKALAAEKKASEPAPVQGESKPTFTPIARITQKSA
ncbi:hypothetical protein [Pectobacterium phage Wc4-1]|uniref:DUF5681 domain-containing protein n=1 Tax=Pectobacterium phage Wc4 TaxID=2652428 RepID=A0A5P8D490_9CAUD|nr:hypothetical protein [Pectobacterium phage Wc4]QFP94023.1 hypothetical protein [Pectobacterium phage Wc4-1]